MSARVVIDGAGVHRRTATGTFLHEPPEPRDGHTCAPPERDVMVRPPDAWLRPEDRERVQPTKVGTTPNALVGARWRCDLCGSVWIVRWDDGVRRHGYTPAHAYWARATWWERWRRR